MQFPLFPRAVELIYPGHSCTGGNTTFLALVRSIHVWIIVHSLWSPVEIASLWLVDPVSRCPVVPLSRERLRASSRGWARYCPFRCPVVPFPLSRCPVVPFPLSRWRAPGPVGGSRSCWRVPWHGSQRAAAIGEPLHVVSMWDSKCG